MPRTGYRNLMNLPTWGLYRDGRLVATIRANSLDDAQALFDGHGLTIAGDVVRPVPHESQHKLS